MILKIGSDFLKRAYFIAALVIVFIVCGPFAMCYAQDLNTISINHDDLQRSYDLYVPKSYNSTKPTALIFGFHGGGGNAKSFAQDSGFTDVADRTGAIVVFPNGTAFKNNNTRLTWNAGGGGIGQAEIRGIDDVGFVREIHRDVIEAYNVDPKRVYATGMSKGGMMSYHLACKASDIFSAIGVVSTSMTSLNCLPDNNISVLHIHGTDDQQVAYKGGQPKIILGQKRSWPPVEDGLDFWRSHNKCSPDQSIFFQNTDTVCKAQACTESKYVSLCMVQNMGHAWPGGDEKRWQKWTGVHTTKSFEAADLIWQFFENSSF